MKRKLTKHEKELHERWLNRRPIYYVLDNPIEEFKRSMLREQYKLPKPQTIELFHTILIHKLPHTQVLIFIGSDGTDGYTYVTHRGWNYLPQKLLQEAINFSDFYKNAIKLRKEERKYILDTEEKEYNVRVLDEYHEFVSKIIPEGLEKKVMQDEKNNEYAEYRKIYLGAIQDAYEIENQHKKLG